MLSLIDCLRASFPVSDLNPREMIQPDDVAQAVVTVCRPRASCFLEVTLQPQHDLYRMTLLADVRELAYVATVRLLFLVEIVCPFCVGDLHVFLYLTETERQISCRACALARKCLVRLRLDLCLCIWVFLPQHGHVYDMLSTRFGLPKPPEALPIVSLSAVAIVTGAGRGIGRDIAVRLARCGFKVAIVSRTESDLLETESVRVGVLGVR